MDSHTTALLSVMTVTMIFEFYAIHIVFLAYREFKGMEYDATGGSSMGGMMGGGGGGARGALGRAANATGSNE